MPLVVTLFNTFIINNTNDTATIDLMAKNMKDNISKESLMDDYKEKELFNLARCLN